MHTGSPEIIYPQAGKDACDFLGSRDPKTDEPFTSLVNEISPSHRVFYNLQLTVQYSCQFKIFVIKF